MTDPETEIPEYNYRTRRREPTFDPLMRRIALGAGGLATLVIIIALVWGGMKPGMGFGPAPVIQAPPGPLRIAPANPGGLVVPGADQQIMSGQSSATPNELAPDAPAPDISAFQPPPPPPPAPPAPSAPSEPVVSAPAAAPPLPPAVMPQGASALAPVPPVTDSRIQVQLAAAVDPAGARSAWAALNGKMPGLLAGHSPAYSHAKVAGVDFWRLRVGGFADIASARQFCRQVRAKGGACTVAAF